MIKSLIVITLFILIILTSNIVIASDYMKCTIPKGTVGQSNVCTIFRSFEDQVIKVRKNKVKNMATFPLKGFINDCNKHGREPITVDAIGAVFLEDLENCIEYDEES